MHGYKKGYEPALLIFNLRGITEFMFSTHQKIPALDRHKGTNGEGLLELDQERRERAHRGPRGLPHPGLAARTHGAVQVLDLLGTGSVHRCH